MPASKPDSDSKDLPEGFTHWPLTDDDKLELIKQQHNRSTEYRSEAQTTIRVFVAVAAFVGILGNFDLNRIIKEYDYTASESSTSFEYIPEIWVTTTGASSSVVAFSMGVVGLLFAGGALFYTVDTLRTESTEPFLGTGWRDATTHSRTRLLSEIIKTNELKLKNMSQSMSICYEWIAIASFCLIYSGLLITTVYLDLFELAALIQTAYFFMPFAMLTGILRTAMVEWKQDSGEMPPLQRILRGFNSGIEDVTPGGTNLIVVNAVITQILAFPIAGIVSLYWILNVWIPGFAELIPV